MNRSRGSWSALSALGLLGAVACSGDSPDGERTGGVLQPLEPGVYHLQAVHSDKCLSVAGASTANGTNIEQTECADAESQKWDIVPRPDGSYRLRPQHSGKCMVALGKPAGDGDNIQQGRCKYRRSKWQVSELGGDVIQLQSQKSGLCADVSGVSTADGANLQQWSCHGNDNQRFRLIPEGGLGGTGGTGGTGGSGGTGGGDECPFELVGWATVGPGTTGGGELPPQVVTTYSELSNALDGSDPRVIHLSGTVDTGTEYLRIEDNKTLRGVDANARIIGGVTIRGSNIIIQNLTVQGKGQGSEPADAMNSNGAENVWLDHLAVYDGGDGLVDLTNGSDHITVSWCKFWYTDSGHTHRLALLFGNSSEKCDIDGGKVNHTVHHNWFSDLVNSRMPRLLFGKGHIFNNYYNSPGNNYCVGAGSWASVLVENNYFQDVEDPHRFQDGHPSYIAVSGNIYDNTSGSQDEGARPNPEGPANSCEEGLETPGPWNPSDYYSYQHALDAAANVPDIVQRCAGPQ